MKVAELEPSGGKGGRRRGDTDTLTARLGDARGSWLARTAMCHTDTQKTPKEAKERSPGAGLKR